jgi:hypothetical protein
MLIPLLVQVPAVPITGAKVFVPYHIIYIDGQSIHTAKGLLKRLAVVSQKDPKVL